MASKRVSTREELRGMKRADLQKLAKDHHIKANLKTEALIDELVQARAAQVSSHQGPSALRKERSNATLILDEQENNKPEPTPKLTDSSLSSSGNGSPVRPKPKDAPKPGMRRPKPPGPAIRREPGVRLPPAVQAAHPDEKGKGKAKVPVYAGIPSRTVSGSSKLPVAKPSPRDQDADAVRGRPTISNLTPPLRPASHSESSSIALLTSRIGKLEHARETSGEARETELEALRTQLKAAQDSISNLAQQNELLQARIDLLPAAATQQDMTNALARLGRLEEQFSRMEVENGGGLINRALSATSSEADPGHYYEAPPQRTEFQTPPNHFERTRRTSRVLAPAPRIDAAGPMHRVASPQTPPPHIRRYSTNPDESPSPTRQPSTTGRILVRPPSTTVPTAGSSMAFPQRGKRRASSFVEDGEAIERAAKRGPDSLMRGDRGFTKQVKDVRVSPEADTEPEEDARPPKYAVKSSSDGSSDSFQKDAPLPALPYELVPTAAMTSTPPASRTVPARAHSIRSTARGQPYDKNNTPRRRGLDKGSPAGPPQDRRDVFGPTPGASTAGPLPFAGGIIPPLKLGRPSNASSYADIETPLASPARPLPAEETPPASRTRFGTEFSTTMKTRFTD